MCPVRRPLFVKYNAVLRATTSKSPFLREQFIKLCSPPDNLERYKKQLGENTPGAFDRAATACNKYATTLHAINSYATGPAIPPQPLLFLWAASD